MQTSTVINLLLVIISFNLAHISGLQKQDKEHGVYGKEAQAYQVQTIASAKLHSNLKKNRVSFFEGQNIDSEIKRNMKWTNNTLLATLTTKNKREIIHSASSPSIIHYNHRTLPKCPPTLTYYNDRYDNPVCYLITEPTSFPPSCPYPTTLEYFDISRHTLVTNEQHWAFTYRNVSDIGKKNCLLKNGKNDVLIPTSCSKKYPGVCAYPYDSNFKNGDVSIPTFNDYCRKRYGNSCISDDFKASPTCYCKIKGRQPRNKFCKKLVEIKEPYLNNILIRLLSIYETCWIGLEKTAVRLSPSNITVLSYKWSSTNTNCKYTYLSGNFHAEKTYGAMGIDGWQLEEDDALTCAICEMEDDDDDTPLHIEIKFKKSPDVIEVKIESAMAVFQNVTCFSPYPDEFQTIDLRYNKGPLLTINLEFTFLVSGYYWCEALQISNLTRVFSNTIFIPSTHGHEYALLVTAPENADERSYMPKSTDVIACNSLTKQFPLFVDVSIPIRPISYNETNGTIQVLCHIHNHFYQLSPVEELNLLSELFQNSTINITNFNIINICVSSVTNSGSRVLKWPETLNGVTTIPEELCLQEDGSPVTRTCTGNFDYGSYWLDVSGTCADISYSNRTHVLDELLKSDNTTSSNLSTNLLNVTQDTINVTSYEIHLISKSLEKLADFDESLNLTDVTMTINNIMHFEPQQLRDSQETLNSTDIILSNLDEILARTETNGYKTKITEKLVVQISDLKTTKINGIKLEKTQNGFKPDKVYPSHQNIDVIEENLELAMIISEQLHNDIVNCLGPESSPNLITTVFYDDVLFNEQNNIDTHHPHPNGRIIGVTIPNFDCPFTAPLQVIFSTSEYNNEQLKCASWNYGVNDFIENTYGEWIVEGDPKTFGNTSYQLCEFQHVTHFTLLVMGDFNDVSLAQTKALDVTTAIGSGLSILGLTMIFLTAIMFRNFRSASSTILLNFSIAITAKIVLLFLADNFGNNKLLCIVLGAALHYVVLSQFCWMLTMAIFQYKRYVVIYKHNYSNVVAKICLFAWGIPLIPVIIILLISRDNYGKNSHGLCYALGNYFLFGVLAPVAVIILINVIVFIAIIISAASSRPNRVPQKNDNSLVLQIKLAILLFFLLGLTWGFGLLASLNGSIVFSYLFCITTALQGFILFLYFIVLNKKTRSLWTKSKLCCCKSEENNNRPRSPQHTNTDANLTTKELLQCTNDDDEL